MSSQFKIRPAKMDDAQPAIDLVCEITSAIRQHEGWSNYQVDTQQSHRLKAFESALKTGVVFLVFNSDELISAANVQLIPNIRHGWHRAHIEEFVVKESYRGKGVGTILINHIKDYCRQNGIKVIKLLCGNQLTATKKFYEKNGFVFTDTGYRCELKDN